MNWFPVLRSTHSLVVKFCVCVSLLIVTADPAMVFAQSDDSDSSSATLDDASRNGFAAKVSIELVLANEQAINVDFAGADLVLEEQIFRDIPKGLPEDWRELTPEKQTIWWNAFIASPAGKAYESSYQEKFNNRQVTKVTPDRIGSVELINVPFGHYILAGKIRGANEKGRHFAAEVYGEFPIFSESDHIDHLALEKVSFSMSPELLVGYKVPDVKFNRLKDDGEINLSSLRGRYVLLDFWATWCGPCLRATPSVKKAYEKHGGKNGRLEVVAISEDRDRQKAIGYTEKKKYPWLQAFADKDSEVLVEFAAQNPPTFWLIAPDGTVAATPQEFYESGFNIEAVLDRKIK